MMVRRVSKPGDLIDQLRTFAERARGKICRRAAEDYPPVIDAVRRMELP